MLDVVAVQTSNVRFDRNLSCVSGHQICKRSAQDGEAGPIMTQHMVEELFALKNQQSQRQEWSLCLSCFASDEGTSYIWQDVAYWRCEESVEMLSRLLVRQGAWG